MIILSAMRFLSALIEWSDATRIPLGQQCGIVSLLDYGVASPGFLSCGEIDWSVCLMDHAATIFNVNIPTPHVCESKKRKWVCTDVDGFTKDASLIHTDSAFGSDPTDLFQVLGQLQDKYQDMRSCSSRRKCRMPFELRNAYKCYSLSRDFAARQFWRTRIQQFRRRWLNDIAVRKHIAIATKGEASEPTKKLYTIDGIDDDGATIFDLERCTSLVATYYGKKMSGATPGTREI